MRMLLICNFKTSVSCSSYFEIDGLTGLGGADLFLDEDNFCICDFK